MASPRENARRLPGKRAVAVLGRTLVFAITLILSFLLGEAAVRLLAGEDSVMFPRYHAAATYGEFRLRRLRPATEFWHTSQDGSWRFVTNSQGFRDERDYAYDKASAVFRVLVLGDSHTQGFEVRQSHTFSRVIERYLDAHGVDAEVMNAGISGFGTAEELAFLETEGIKYRPDAVVVGFFQNDFEDNVKAGLFGLTGDALELRKTEHQPGVAMLSVIQGMAPLRWLSENSHLFSRGLNFGWDAAKALLLTREQARLQTEFAVPTEKVNDYQVRLTEALFARMHRFCRQHGIALIVVDIPMKPHRDPGRAFASSVPPRLAAFLADHTDAYIDSESVLEPYGRITEIHVPHGQNHISEFSHLMLGIAAAQRLLELRAPPGEG